MRLLLLVGIGSFIGGVCRYLLSTFVQAKTPAGFPYGTLMVNLLGCLLIGILFGLFEKTEVGAETRLLLVTGVLGGFTTFSAFSGETYHLIRDGHFSMALIYVLISMLVGVCLTFAGAWIIKTSIPTGN
jgi:fluoride exporter